MDKSDIIARVCDALTQSDDQTAAQIIEREYPFEAVSVNKRTYTKFQRTLIFIRDGFVDRYSGNRVVFPPVLNLISGLLPNEFPAHRNWKMSVSHMAYWELSPMIDHVVPSARGGKDEDRNWITSSPLSNSKKANWTLEELGWELKPPGDLGKWDGMLNWFLEFVNRDKSILEHEYVAGEIKSWYSAAVRGAKEAQINDPRT